MQTACAHLYFPRLGRVSLYCPNKSRCQEEAKAGSCKAVFATEFVGGGRHTKLCGLSLGAPKSVRRQLNSCLTPPEAPVATNGRRFDSRPNVWGWAA